MRRAFLQIAVMLTLLTLLLSGLSNRTTRGDDPQIPTNGLKVDEHWADVYQQNDHKTLNVEEFIFFNNTGTSAFNGTIYSWLPKGSTVRSTCCGNALNMACRMEASNSMYCFTVSWQDDNIIYGRPFSPSSFISHFGQREKIAIEAQSQNSSYSDSLDLNITLGASSEGPSISETFGPGVHIDSDRGELGVKATIISGMPVNMTLIHTLNITNNGTGNDTIDLDAPSLPTGWAASFIHGSRAVDSVPIGLNETESVVLHMSIPSYIVEVKISYSIELESSGEGRQNIVLDKEFLYDNDFIEYYVFTVEGDNLSFSGNLTVANSVWSPDTNRTWHRLIGADFQLGSAIDFTISWVENADLSWLLLAVAVIIFALLLAGVSMRRRRADQNIDKAGEGQEKSAENGSKTTGDESEKIMAERNEVKAALERLEADHEKGILPAGVYTGMREKLDKKDAKLKKRLGEVGSKGESDLLEQKKKMLDALKQLERDHGDGKISSGAYKELRSEYKNRTIEIMKQIDKLKRK
jgi:hypothetical protein